MLLCELESKVTSKDGVNIHEPDIEASNSTLTTMGVGTTKVSFTKEELDLFRHRLELVKSVAGDYESMSTADKQSLTSSVIPPKTVSYYHAYTLVKNPKNSQELLKVLGLMSALKGRNTTEIMSPEDIDKFLKAAVERMTSKAQTFGSRNMQPKGSDKDLGTILYKVYNRYLEPYMNTQSKKPKNVVLVPLSSSSSLVDHFASELHATLGAPIVDGAFLKNSWPVLSAWNLAAASSDDSHVLRMGESYLTDLIKMRGNIEAPHIRALLDAMAELKPGSIVPAEHQEKYKGYIEELRPLIYQYIAAYTKNIAEIVQQIKDWRASCTDARECKQVPPKLVNALKMAINKRKQIPFPSPTHRSQWIKAAPSLGFIRDYMSRQDDLEVEIDDLTDLNKIDPAHTVDTIGAFLKQARVLLNAAIYNPFKIHREYANPNTDRGHAFSSYMVLRKQFHDDLEGKDVILVDDNVGTGQSIADAVKAIYFAGIAPKSIICFTPHYFKTDSTIKATKAATETRTEFNRTERANRPRPEITPEMIEKKLKDFGEIADLNATGRAGTERVVKKFAK